ncbi:family 43 glycosylhydrolase [Demequina sp. SYSU T00039]|uniref:Family 43 glycosylhydrolase n=1 Tax=Demequina lignilytica TaxID=3051663 RepID=A0AAW7M8L4_9MICO|nr:MULTISPECIES: family 43 glycosylhydrolase [unclassified Demequina]MDN4478392.1 family 43 glycosylhydrolase [Demequina sp. SYSU T00039-1]MDN4487101.1 family 43 glycosylhydrolase [Demequina sp. SYSU T00039]MDN4489812.1 family 43 glycosylhydrolase [Demequina sp. SYSU T00068]
MTGNPPGADEGATPDAPASDTSVRLAAYHRAPTSEAEANNADIALSLHLAIEREAGWEPLFDNYGVFFARTSETPPALGTSDEIIRSLVDPCLLATPDGGYAVVATRVARGGGPDGTERSSVLVAVSPDLLEFREVGLLELPTAAGVHRPAAAYDAAAGAYVLTWVDEAGSPFHCTVGDLGDASTVGAPVPGEAAIPGLIDAAGIPGAADRASTLRVPADVARALEIRLGPIRNTGAEPLAAIEVPAGATLAPAMLPARLHLTYDDGSTGSLAIAWDLDALAAIDTAAAGDHEVPGAVIQPVYPTPFADERADPSIVPVEVDGERRFLMIATKDLHMDPVANSGEPVGMPIRMAARIEDLSDEALEAGRVAEVDLLVHGSLDARGEAMTGCFWAPEIHLIDGTLSILFMPSYGDPTDMWTGRASIVQLRKAADGRHLDPTVPAHWTAARQVVRADGSALNHLQGISLDMTYLEDSGTHYYSWQMLGSVFIATFDPADPTRLTSDPVRILAPEFAWDNLIAEGPNIHRRGDTLHLLYSGSSVGDSYTTGLATAPAGAGVDLTDPAAWRRLGHPIQKSGPYNGEMQLGTGHGMWSEDEHGNLLYVFHARTDHKGLTGRDTFVRRVHWAADGMPVLDMETEEELLPELRDVSVTVRVR